MCVEIHSIVIGAYKLTRVNLQRVLGHDLLSDSSFGGGGEKMFSLTCIADAIIMDNYD